MNYAKYILIAVSVLVAGAALNQAKASYDSHSSEQARQDKSDKTIRIALEKYARCVERDGNEARCAYLLGSFVISESK